MSKNNLSFSDSLHNVLNQKTNNKPMKLDLIIESLKRDGNKDEADSIFNAVTNEEIPLYTVYKALQNSGYVISYSALTNARSKYLIND